MIIALTAVNWRNQAALLLALLITFIRINGRWTGQNRKGLKKKGFRFLRGSLSVLFLECRQVFGNFLFVVVLKAVEVGLCNFQVAVP